MNEGTVLLLAGILLLFAIVTTKFSVRLNVPTLILFVFIGMLAGTDVTGLIDFADFEQARLFGTIALVIILFDGGLNTKWPNFKTVLPAALSLATVGVLVTTGIIALVAHYLLDFSWPFALLIGALIGSTDAAAVFSLLNGRPIDQKVKHTLEAESGTNDPMAVFLTILFTEFALDPASFSLIQGVLSLFYEMGLGLAIGLLIGWVLTTLMNRIQLQSSALYPTLLISGALLSYGVATSLHASGFLAVYVTGIWFSNHDLIYRDILVRFSGSLSHLAEVGMFIMLGLLVFPKQLLDPSMLVVSGIIVLTLILIARPLAVWLSLLPFRYNFREQSVITAAGLRGAVPIILATYPLSSGLPDAYPLFNIVFFTVMTSALLQGTALPWIVKLMKLDAKPTIDIEPLIQFMTVANPNAEIVEVSVPSFCPIDGKTLQEIEMPQDLLVVAVIRDDAILTPRGQTRLIGGDQLLILTPKQSEERIRQLIASLGI
ncbi:potassium/proton antiporter [Exiguobacterium antarcticum]|uniref:potassium/proton antiporter n=1 Tax=Exiguobacterium antarcticum TaxID=132920 RepID=UPI000285F029|nr:potassium/proton antiporter [Exiguobacterium antarcticum]AFS70608.1 Potassium/hydrogen antiporter [Exiguobacterium antarcticum B7]